MARYQDLAREEAIGLEARILLRLPPVMEIKSGASISEVEEYFSALLSASYLLADISIGNVNFEEANARVCELDEHLHNSTFLSDRSQHSAECPLLILNGAGAPGHIRYFHTADLHERDRRNPELSMSLGMAAWSLSKIGMTKETFTRPAEIDCDVVLKSRGISEPYLDPAFFARPLWPHDTPYAVSHILLEEWKESMSNLGLTGLLRSFESCANGVFLTANKRQRSEGSMTNNVTLNFGNSSTFTGPLAVGQNIQIAYKSASEANSKDLAEKLSALVEVSSRLAEKLATESEKLEALTQVKTLVDEAKKEKPSKWLIGASASGLIESAGKIAGMVEPLSKAITAVTDLISR